jgi:sirohydrochlorin ferrochelatase
MNGIIILAHGSKKKSTEEVLNKLADKVKNKKPDLIVKKAYLQFSEKNLLTAIKEFVDEGVLNIKIMPMFLFDGVHVTTDIPEEIEKIKEDLAVKNLKITLTKHIGADDRIADIIIDRINGI